MHVPHLHKLLFLFFLLSSCVSNKKLNKDFIQQITQDTLLNNAHVGIAIWNTKNERFILQYNSNKNFVPASNVKIAALYVVMKYLPDSLASLDYYDTPDTLFIIPKGNPAFFHPDFKDLPDFAFLKNSGKPIVILPALWETEIYGKGWAWDDHQSVYMPKRSPLPIGGNLIKIEETNRRCYPSVTDMYEYSAMRLSDTLDVPVIVSATERNFNQSLIPFYSVSRDSICKKMMYESDNFIAEQLLLMTSDKLLGRMNETKLIEKILSDTIISFPQKPVWVDGSGLSRYNLFTPEDMVYLLKQLETEFGPSRIEAIFPTGNQGTLKGYFEDKAGCLFAKTGTLSGQMSLSGYLKTKKNTPLIFSIMINNHTGKSAAVRKFIAAYLDRVWRRY